MIEKHDIYKLLLLDVDGTLVESKGDALPSKRVAGAVKAASKLIDVAIVTGRPYALTRDVISELGLTGYGVFNGGAEIIEIATGNRVRRQTMSIDLAREAAAIALSYKYAVFNTLGDDEIKIKTPQEIIEPSDKILIENVPLAVFAQIITALDTIKEVVVHPVSSWSEEADVNITVAHEYASKRHGAEQIIELLGGNRASTMAIGDGYNDIPLIQTAGLGIAMGDAPDEVKRLADYITDTLANDGVAAAIEKFILQ